MPSCSFCGSLSGEGLHLPNLAGITEAGCTLRRPLRTNQTQIPSYTWATPVIAISCNNNDMPASSEFIPRLHSRGFRVTSQRMAILNVLGRSGTHLTAVQIHARASRELPGLTGPTVYRTLEKLARAGVVWPLHLENGHLAYELAGRNHHHLVSTACGEEIEFPGMSLDAVYAKLEASSRYRLNRDHLTLTGLCPKCQAQPTRKRVP